MRESKLNMTSAAAGLYWEKKVPALTSDHGENVFWVFIRQSYDKEYIWWVSHANSGMFPFHFQYFFNVDFMDIILLQQRITTSWNSWGRTSGYHLVQPYYVLLRHIYTSRCKESLGLPLHRAWAKTPELAAHVLTLVPGELWGTVWNVSYHKHTPTPGKQYRCIGTAQYPCGYTASASQLKDQQRLQY